MMQTEGEIAGATAAGRRRDPVRALDDGHDVDRGRRRGRPRTAATWFQLYMWKDRDRSMALVERARPRPGFDTLLVTVDVPVAGARLRDVRNGMTIPPTLTPRTVLNALPRPGLVVQLPHHRAAGLRLARRVVGHASPTCSTRCSTRP